MIREEFSYIIMLTNCVSSYAPNITRLSLCTRFNLEIVAERLICSMSGSGQLGFSSISWVKILYQDTLNAVCRLNVRRHPKFSLPLLFF